MRNIIWPFLLLIILSISSCGPSKRDAVKNLKKIEGERYTGGTFKYNEVEYFKSIFPLEITEVVGFRLSSQIYQGLVSLNQQDLLIEPCIAESWEIDETSTVYTFKIRSGVFFHDDPCFSQGKGRQVLASDFKYCFDKLCTSSADNKSFSLFRDKVKGAEAYYHSTKNDNLLPEGVSGIVANDSAQTLTIELTAPFSSFLNILAMINTAVFPREAVETYKDGLRSNKAIGTGPFVMVSVRENDKVILKKNLNYWQSDMYENKLPYLNAIEVSYIKDNKTALMEFEKGNLDLMYKMPLDILDDIIDDKTGELTNKYKSFILQKTPALKIDYLGFLHNSDAFNSLEVRKAFNMAINRKKLIDYTLKGSAISAKYGIVPPAVVGYNTKNIAGHEFNPDQARKLMELAGYPNGEGFPQVKLTLNTGGGRNKLVCEAIAQMLKDELNVDVQIEEYPFAQHLDLVDFGRSKFFREGWVADYPDPENFLQLFLKAHIPNETEGRAYPNSPRFSSNEYDSLYQAAISIMDDEERFAAYSALDQKIIDDAVVMPLYYEYYYRLIQPYVVDCYQNPMEYRNFKDVYFSPSLEF